MIAKASRGSGDFVYSFFLPVWTGAALIFATSMIRHWHQTPSIESGLWSTRILDIASSLGAILVFGTIVWRMVKKGRILGAGRPTQSEADERLRYIGGQAAAFAMAITILVLGLFPAYAGHFRDISAVSLSYATCLILMVSWLGRLLWLNRD